MRALQKRSKTGAVPTIDGEGVRHASKGEAKRWQALQLMERSGLIRDLKRQVRYSWEIQYHANGRVAKRKGAYVADFTYYEGDRFVVEDFKGWRTDEFKKKKKLMLELYGIEILETK